MRRVKARKLNVDEALRGVRKCAKVYFSFSSQVPSKPLYFAIASVCGAKLLGLLVKNEIADEK